VATPNWVVCYHAAERLFDFDQSSDAHACEVGAKTFAIQNIRAKAVLPKMIAYDPLPAMV
jgi:hypothetical protein